MLQRGGVLCAVALTVLGAPSLRAAQRQEIAIYSAAMSKDVPALVFLPDAYEEDGRARFPVVYLLHGATDNHRSWEQALDSRTPDLPGLADAYDVIVVCPDAGRTSWYFDSPIDSTYRYETFVAEECVSHVDAHYRTRASRDGRALCGYSMGGHGALYLGIRHRHAFRVAVSISGGVDIRPWPDNWDIRLRLGTQQQYPENWEEHTVINVAKDLQDAELTLAVDSGNDFFRTVNRALHDQLLEDGITHVYEEHEGGHSAAYWSVALIRQMPFIAENLAALREPDNPQGIVPRVEYERFAGFWSAVPDFEGLTADATGSSGRIRVGRPDEPTQYFGYRFTGFVDAPEDDVYAFFTASDDGSKLYIGETLVVDNDGAHGLEERSGRIGLQAGMHPITVTYFQGNGGKSLSVSWSAGGLSKVEIPAGSLFHVNRGPVAVASASQATTTVGAPVLLRGDGSYDPDSSPNDTLSYHWTCNRWPAGTAEPSAVNASGNWAQATFVPSSAGEYVWQVTVDDGLQTDTSTVTVTATVPPISMTLAVPTATGEGDGNVEGTVLLSRALVAGEGMTVSLSSSHPTRAAVDSSVRVEPGESSARFTIRVEDDSNDGPDVLVTLTASADECEDAVASLLIVDDDDASSLSLTMALSVPSAVREDAGSVLGAVLLNRVLVAGESVTVSLESSDPERATVDSPVTIDEGQSSAEITIRIHDNSGAGADVQVTFTAFAVGMAEATAHMTIVDDDVSVDGLRMILAVPSSVREDDGSVYGTVILSRALSAGESVTVSLESSDPERATVDSPVTIGEGQSSAEITIRIQDNSGDGADVRVTLTAFANGMAEATAQMTIVDDDVSPQNLSMTLAVPSTVRAGEGSVQGTVHLSRVLVLGESVTVALRSSNPTRAAVDSSVTMSATEQSAAFAIRVGDDGPDGSDETVTITASANGMADAAAQLTIVGGDEMNARGLGGCSCRGARRRGGLGVFLVLFWGLLLARMRRAECPGLSFRSD